MFETENGEALTMRKIIIIAATHVKRIPANVKMSWLFDCFFRSYNIASATAGPPSYRLGLHVHRP